MPAARSAPSRGSIPSSVPRLPRIVLGIVAALLAAIVALPSRWCCSGSSTGRSRPVTAPSSGPRSRSCWSSAIAEALLIVLRRWSRAHARHPRRGGACATASTRSCRTCRWRSTTAGRAGSCSRARWATSASSAAGSPSASCCSSATSSMIVDRLRRSCSAGRGSSALLFLVCSIPLWIFGFLFEQQVLGRRPPLAGPAGRPRDRRRGVGARHPRAEGVRARLALAREVPRQAEELRGTEIEKARAIAALWLWLLLVPDVAFALSLLGGVMPGRERRADGRAAVRVLRDGDRAALADRVDRVAAVDDASRRARPSTGSSRCSTSRTRSAIPSSPRTIAEPRGPARRSTTCTSATRTRPTACATSSTASTSSSSRARRWRSSASPGRARRR